MVFRVSTSACASAGLVLAMLVSCARADEKAVAIPPPSFDETPSGVATETATFAGGCFWGVQGVFQRVQGVLKAVSGYAGGKQETAHYEMVGSGTTGHACGNLGRRFVGIEKDAGYFSIAQEQIATAYAPLRHMQVAG